MDKRAVPEMLDEAIDGFQFSGALIEVERHSAGHIHDSFLLSCTGGRYLLQRLNDRVFPNVAVVASNGERVVAHLSGTGRPVPELVDATSGTKSLRTRDGALWRAFAFLEGTVDRHVAQGCDDAFETARAFADYRLALCDLPAPVLPDTIEHFHDLDRRLAALDATASADPLGRRIEVDEELERARRLSRQVKVELSAIERTQPRWLVHNDAKLSNVRFDVETGRAVCVLDYDTTMVGAVRSDVGELVRSLTTHAAEDSGDNGDVDFDLEMLEAVAAGYLSTSPDLEESEVSALWLAGPELTVENAVRFLTDHMNGDAYFAIDRPSQNLDRGRMHLRLAERMLDARDDVRLSFERAAREARRAASSAHRKGAAPS